MIPQRPDNQDVWVGGHWAANGNDYAWHDGSWQRPERGKRDWTKGQWEHGDRGWYYVDGHWT
ncbi:MAG: hypothetical protein WBQ26_14420 [Gemmatimonadaceae bacterium]|nr:hypothetical protein [Gemmatimonadaceae bacterium]